MDQGGPATADLPEPLTPPDCDLRGMPFMPIDIIRLLDSDLFALSTGDEFKAAFSLWGKSWFQIPAGSLPVDDRVLAHLAGHRRETWGDVSGMALRGWIECADGRLYHPVVAEKALEAWGRRGKWREREDNKSERQQRWREKLRILSNRLRDVGVTVPATLKAKELEALCKKHGVDAHVDGETSTVDAKATGKDRGQGTGDRGHKSTAKAVGAAGRGARLPADFVVPADWIDWAVGDQKLSEADARSEAANFVDWWHAKSGKDAAKVDWKATWRTWVRRSNRPRTNGRQANGESDPRSIGGMRIASPC